MAMAAPVAAAPPAAAGQPAPPTTQTVSRLAAGMVQNIRSKVSRFQLALDPIGLGRVDINVRIGPDGAISATLNFNNPQSADALKAQAGELREALQQAGFTLSGSDLSFTAGGSNQQSGQGQGQPSAPPSYAAASAPPEPALPPASVQAPSSPSDGLDIRI